MQSLRDHALTHGSERVPVFSPVETLAETTLELMSDAGFPTVVWTVNDPARMAALIDLGVDGIITDRPDLLLDVARAYDGSRPRPMTSAGRFDRDRLDAQGHRGARGLRPENTLPAIEAGLDHLVTTLEVDVGVTADGIAVLSHDPALTPITCRRRDGVRAAPFICDLTADEIRADVVADRLPFGPDQSRDPGLSPVSVAFAGETGMPDIHAIPTLDELFAFVQFYREHTRSRGRRRSDNAADVRFSIETKVRRQTADLPGGVVAGRTAAPRDFVTAIGDVVAARGLTDRVDVQSFDDRTLRGVHDAFPGIRTVALAAGLGVPSASPSRPCGDRD